MNRRLGTTLGTPVMHYVYTFKCGKEMPLTDFARCANSPGSVAFAHQFDTSVRL